MGRPIPEPKRSQPRIDLPHPDLRERNHLYYATKSSKSPSCAPWMNALISFCV